MGAVTDGLATPIPPRGGAVFSPDRIHRYHLWQRFDRGVGRVAFVGLNPSTADERANDPTVRRCIGFAEAWATPTSTC